MSFSAGLSWVQTAYTLVFGRLLRPGGRPRRAVLAVLEEMLFAGALHAQSAGG
jgi:hypothetical protein